MKQNQHRYFLEKIKRALATALLLLIAFSIAASALLIPKPAAAGLMRKVIIGTAIGAAVHAYAKNHAGTTGAAGTETISGKVIGVMDGDTIEVLDANKTPRRIRLAGIDAPEKAQPFGARAKQHLSDQVFGKQVEVLSNQTDKYGRTVGKVMVSGNDANLEQVRSGFAWHYKEYQKDQSVSDRAAYANAETSARTMKSGLWNDPKPMAPWEWRHGGKTESTAQSESSDCPCGGATSCTGSRGGQYCIASNGKKKY